MKKIKLEKIDHKEIGEAIKELRVSLMLLGGIAEKSCGKASEITKQLRSATEAVGMAKMLLDNKFITEISDEYDSQFYSGEAKPTEKVREVYDRISK